MLLGGWRRRSALFIGDFRTGPSHKPYKGLGELTPGVCGDFGAQRSRRDGPTADLLHCAQTLSLAPHGFSASTHPYRRLIPHLFGIFRLQELVGAFFAVPLPRAETGTGADGLVIWRFLNWRVVGITAPFGGRGGPRWRRLAIFFFGPPGMV